MNAAKDVMAKLEEDKKNKTEELNNNIKELETKVEEIPSLLIKEYEKGKKETTDLLNKEHKFATELLSKDFQNKIDRQADKIESLNKEVKKVNDTNKALQDKLDKAYAQIKDMATKTVEATGGVKILGNNQVENK